MKSHSPVSQAAAFVLLAAAFVSSFAAAEAISDLEEEEVIEMVGPMRQGPVDSTDFRSPTPPPHKLSLTISALHLIGLFPEVSLEVRPIPHFGVVATGGAMWYRNGAHVQELGGQLRYYPAGGHNGFHLGGEGFWGQFNLGETGADDPFIATIFDYRSFSVYGGGPFAGVKHVLNQGVTVELQLGVQAIGVRPRGLDEPAEVNVYPIVNFNFGKSW